MPRKEGKEWDREKDRKEGMEEGKHGREKIKKEN